MGVGGVCVADEHARPRGRRRSPGRVRVGGRHAAHVILRLRIGGGWGHGRPTAMVVLLALIPVATIVPALAALALAAAACATLIAYEALRYRYARTWIRGHRGEFTMEEVARVAGPGSAPPSGQDAPSDPNADRPIAG